MGREQGENNRCGYKAYSPVGDLGHNCLLSIPRSRISSRYQRGSGTREECRLGLLMKTGVSTQNPSGRVNECNGDFATTTARAMIVLDEPLEKLACGPPGKARD